MSNKFNKRQGQVDITIQNERGHRTRIVSDSIETVRVRIFSHCDKVWDCKSDSLKAQLAKELVSSLKSANEENGFSVSVGGLIIAPTLSFASVG